MQNPHYYILKRKNPENSIFTVLNRENSLIVMTKIKELNRSMLESRKFDMTNVHIFKIWLLELKTEVVFSDTTGLIQLVAP